MIRDECSQFNERLSGWLDRSWEAQDTVPPAELSEHAGQCSRCHRQLVLAMRLVGSDYDQPDGLEDRVVERIADAELPRTRRFIPSLAAAALFVVALGAGVLFGTGRSRSIIVELTLHAPQAASVSVVGDWNGWDPVRDPMTDADNDGVWQIELKLKSDTEHMYQFVIDQRTRTPDPLALVNVDDGFGGVNSVLNL